MAMISSIWWVASAQYLAGAHPGWSCRQRSRAKAFGKFAYCHVLAAAADNFVVNVGDVADIGDLRVVLFTGESAHQKRPLADRCRRARSHKQSGRRHRRMLRICLNKGFFATTRVL